MPHQIKLIYFDRLPPLLNCIDEVLSGLLKTKAVFEVSSGGVSDPICVQGMDSEAIVQFFEDSDRSEGSAAIAMQED